MAKKTNTTASAKLNRNRTKERTPGQLFETQKITTKVKRLANKYKEASVEKSQATSTFAGARDALIEAMKEDGIEKVLLELGGVRKVIVLDEKDVLKLETVKESPAAGEAS